MKRKLHLDELAVESFELLSDAAARRGTVRGNDDSVGFSGEWSCIPEATCGETCPLSCTPTCVNCSGSFTCDCQEG